MHDDRLTGHPLLAPLTDDERRRAIELMTVRTLPAGRRVITAGEPSPGLHLLLDGEVEVSVELDGRPRQIALLGPGSWFGELGMLSGEPATADVTTGSEVTVARVAAADAPALLAVDAVHLQLDSVARRRAATNTAMSLPPIAVSLRAAEGASGRTLLRPLWPDDWRLMAAARSHVSDDSLRMRFFTVPPLTERTFRRQSNVDLRDQFAWVIVHDDELIGIGRHALQAEDRRVAELAVLVADAFQGRGVGSLLVTAIAAAAQAHGAEDLSAVARSENHAVRRLLERFGASWDDADDGTTRTRWPVTTALARSRDEALAATAGSLASAALAGVEDV